RHLKEYFCRPDQEFPSAFQWGIRNLSPDSMAAKVVAKGVRTNVVKMARQFITGESAEDALPNIKRIRKDGLAFTLDLLGEATLSRPEAEEYQRRYLDLITTLVKEQHRWPALGDVTGDLDWGVSPKVNISIKPSSFNPRLHPANFEGSVAAAKEMVRPIFRAAKEAGAFINIDVEQYAVKDLTLSLFQSLMDEEEFRDWPYGGVVIQAYLKDSETDARRLIEWAKSRPAPVTVRLVKGAYWDYETVVARQENWRVPVFEDKAETDANFERVAALILENHHRVRLACASHNLRSIAFVLEYATRLGVPRHEVEYQVLFGMAEPVRIALQGERVPLRVYATVGEMIPGMAYLVRRLLENTSNESFLRKSYADDLPIEALIQDPRRKIPEPAAAPPWDGEEAPFYNEPHYNWAEPRAREAMYQGLERVRGRFGRTYPLYINGDWLETPVKAPSYNPARDGEVVGHICQAGPEEALRALAGAEAAFPAWRDTPPEDRADLLFRAADLGKTWTEADADVTEAIDFLDYYAREMIRLGKPRRLISPPGETNLYFYQPKGLAAVIAPWNFPLAISMGMVSAALVAGNCVLYKPASLTSAVGAGVAELFHEAGLPPGVLAYLPGPGSTVGRMLVEDRRVSLIAFTGSREVGLDLVRRAAEVAPGQQHIKKVIAELGGKNAIIVDSDADLDEAVSGLLKSAFGYQGQKCSACSRAIVLEENYDRFLGRLVEGARSIVIGDPADPATDMGPVIDHAAKEKILGYIERGRQEGRLLLLREGPGHGAFAPLAIFDGLHPQATLNQEEVFGPVLSVIKVRDMDEALGVANGVSYALTGGLYSRSPLNIQRVMAEFRVGNLYINRGCTGAMVGRQAFGGFKMSGIGSKSGGPDYLLQFMEPRCTTENTLRRGFAPAE
ncbi:MAG: proline dehydrogenase family protein, partial [Thermodesulfobacteriota bacterium]